MEYLNTITELKLCSTTPHKALQLLNSCPLPETFDDGSKEPSKIFRAFFLFIIERRPDASVNGIWQELLLKTIRYSKNLAHYAFGLRHDIKGWLERALSSSENCNNLYIRLELFRLVRIFWLATLVLNKSLCDTFVCTISQILPQHFYHGDHFNHVLFGSQDMSYILRECENMKLLPWSLSNGLITNLQNTLSNKDTRFVLHCVNFSSVFATMAVSKLNSRIQESDILNCFDILHIMMRAVDINTVDWFRSNMVEVLRDITKAILGQQDNGEAMRDVMYTRDLTVTPLCSKTNGLPSLLLDRQLHNSQIRAVQRHALLFRELTRVYHKNMPFADEDNDAEERYEEKWFSRR